MHKTGSSSIQETLYAQRDKLEDFRYLDMGLGNASGPLQHVFVNSQELLKRNSSKGVYTIPMDLINKKKFYRSRFKKELQLAQSENKNLIVSAEGLVSLSLEELYELKVILLKYFDSIEIVAYIRKLKGYVESAFQQLLKYDYKEFSIKPLLPGYKAKFNKFEKIFGESALNYWIFDNRILKNNCVVFDFCERLCIDVPEKSIVRINESLSSEAIKFLYIYRLFGPGFGNDRNSMRENTLLVGKLSELSGNKIYFSSHFLQPIVDESVNEIEWMEERVGKGILSEEVDINVNSLNSDEDLLTVHQLSLDWLSKELNENIASDITTTALAEKIHKLRLNICQTKINYINTNKKTDIKTKQNIGLLNSSLNTGEHIMDSNFIKVRDIMASIKEKEPQLPYPDDRILRKIISGVLNEISQFINESEDGKLKVAGLGVFRVNTVIAQQGDQKGQSVKKINFIPS